MRTAAARLYERSPETVKTVALRGLSVYWRAGARNHLLPDFLIIGAQRAGTSSLYTYLRKNPLVGKARRKEIHYFDFKYDRGVDWYRRQFPTVSEKLAAERRLGGQFRTGESSPYYLFDPLVPARVRETLPDVKLVALLRDPVARAYSHYQLQCRYGNEHLSFEEAIERESERISGHEESNRAPRKFSYLARGIYVDQLERWFSHFTREQILVLRSEDLFEDPPSVIETVSAFIGVPPWPLQKHRRHNAASYPTLAPSIQARLSDYFREHNRRLYDFLGRDFGWG